MFQGLETGDGLGCFEVYFVFKAWGYTAAALSTGLGGLVLKTFGSRLASGRLGCLACKALFTVGAADNRI